MAEVSGFKHISVSADSDDDVVIWAGTGAEGASLEVPDSVQIQNVGAEGASLEVPDSVQFNQAPQPVQAPAPVERTAQPVAKNQGYRETTLDDLKSEPMSKTQKIIIACAIAAVAAAVVYYFVFMR